MKNPIGPYPGRQLFIGLTPDGKPCLAYLVTGRSPASRERKAMQIENKVAIGPLQSIEYDPLRHYTALEYDNNTGVAAISNGIQTDAIFEVYRLLQNVQSEPGKEYLETVMEGAGAEPDSMHTPRIGGVVTRKANGAVVCAVSIKRHDMRARAWNVETTKGSMTGVSTYGGDLENPPPFGPTHSLPKIKLEVSGAREIARYLFDISAAENQGQDIRVCSVGAVLTDNGWEVAIVNAH